MYKSRDCKFSKSASLEQRQGFYVQMAGMQIWYDHNLEVLVEHLRRMKSFQLLFLQLY